MTIEAPLSRYKKQNLMIAIAALFGLGIWFYYDGYHNQRFIEKNTEVNELGEKRPNATLVINRKAPPYMFAAGVAVIIYAVVIRGKKVVADESSLVAGGKTVAYDTIEKIDKTFFDRKGFVVITYKDEQGNSRDLKLSDRTYDNLPALLDHVVAKIS